jgi:hypothetical protein
MTTAKRMNKSKKLAPAKKLNAVTTLTTLPSLVTGPGPSSGGVASPPTPAPFHIRPSVDQATPQLYDEVLGTGSPSSATNTDSES